MKPKTSRPFVTVKFAQTLDGRIATRTGDSKWISSLESRRLAHRLRSQHDAVLVGVNTVIKDNPRLNVRLVKGKNPIKVIVDSKLRIPLKAKLLRGKAGKTNIIAATRKASSKRIIQFQKLGVRVLTVPVNRDGQVDLKKLLRLLREQNIRTMLVEGGGKIITSFLKQHLVDRMVVITAPKILGEGLESVGDFTERGLKRIGFSKVKVYQSGEDIVIDAQVKTRRRQVSFS